MDLGWTAILLIFICLLITVCVFFVYAGLFSTIEVKAAPPPFGEIFIAYQFAKGPYHKAGALFTRAHSLAPGLHTLGIYYDEPSTTPANNLRYIVGLILSEDEEEPDKDLMSVLEKEDFKFMKLPAIQHAVMANFPFNCTLSVLLAVARVYPKMAEYIREHALCAYPMIEIYKGNNILFLAPLSCQDLFFAPEALECTLPEESEEPEVELLDEGGAGDQIIKTAISTQPITETATNTSDEEKTKTITASEEAAKKDVEISEPDIEISKTGDNVDEKAESSNGEESTGSSFEEVDIEPIKDLGALVTNETQEKKDL